MRKSFSGSLERRKSFSATEMRKSFSSLSETISDKAAPKVHKMKKEARKSLSAVSSAKDVGEKKAKEAFDAAYEKTTIKETTTPATRTKTATMGWLQKRSGSSKGSSKRKGIGGMLRGEKVHPYLPVRVVAEGQARWAGATLWAGGRLRVVRLMLPFNFAKRYKRKEHLQAKHEPKHTIRTHLL